jgi:hypothetical protein
MLENLAPVLGVGLLIGLPTVGWVITDIVKNWRKVRVSEHLAALKQSMIDRGMSADEIERVVAAGVPGSDHPVKAT